MVELIFIKGYKMNESTLKGIDVKNTICSESSRAKYFGINSPNKRIRNEDMINICTSFNENITDKNTAPTEAKVILTILFPIRDRKSTRLNSSHVKIS